MNSKISHRNECQVKQFFSSVLYTGFIASAFNVYVHGSIYILFHIFYAFVLIVETCSNFRVQGLSSNCTKL